MPGFVVRGEDSPPEKGGSALPTEGSHPKVLKLERQDMLDEDRVASVDGRPEVGVCCECQSVFGMAGLEEVEEAIVSGCGEILEDYVCSEKGVELREFLGWQTPIVLFDVMSTAEAK